MLCANTLAMVSTMKIRTYEELSKYKTFKDRFDYLALDGRVASNTFGFDRYLNQVFYKSDKWRKIRDIVILRDNGCDLGVAGYDIYGKVIIHHMNPLNQDDIVKQTDYLLNPNYLICTSHNSHNAIHYGSFEMIDKEPIERVPNDTCPWKTIKV